MRFANTRELQLTALTFQILIHENTPPGAAWRMWKLVPVRVEGVFVPSQLLSGTIGSDSLPSYDGEAWRSSAHAQHAESERDEFGTVVTEVTIVTTRKRYRVEDD